MLMMAKTAEINANTTVTEILISVVNHRPGSINSLSIALFLVLFKIASITGGMSSSVPLLLVLIDLDVEQGKSG